MVSKIVLRIFIYMQDSMDKPLPIYSRQFLVRLDLVECINECIKSKVLLNYIMTVLLEYINCIMFPIMLAFCSSTFRGSLPISQLVSCGQTAIFLQGIIALSISTRKNIGSGVIPITKSFLTPLSRLELLKCLLSLPQCLKMA